MFNTLPQVTCKKAEARQGKVYVGKFPPGEALSKEDLQAHFEPVHDQWHPHIWNQESDAQGADGQARATEAREGAGVTTIPTATEAMVEDTATPTEDMEVTGVDGVLATVVELVAALGGHQGNLNIPFCSKNIS